MFRKSKYCIIIVVIILVFLQDNAYAQQYNEDEVKAAFLCNFSKFVEWPDNSFTSDTSSIVIAFLGQSSLYTISERLAANIKIGNRKLRIVHYENSNQIAHIHILYISPSEKNNFQEILTKTSKNPILTVSETEGFCQLKGMINFSKKKTKFGFEINTNSAKQVGLKISSKLLGLATIID